MFHQHHPIILASASPRRAELLSQIGVKYIKQIANIDEKPKNNETAHQLVSRLALQKARAVQQENIQQQTEHANLPVLGVDTIVCCDGIIMGKPQNKADAFSMLKKLSATSHQVYTAISLLNEQRSYSLRCRTDVMFAPIEDAEINAYLESEDVLDKAGSYAIQGQAARFIQSIHGSYSNVVGLPLYETYQLILNFKQELNHE